MNTARTIKRATWIMALAATVGAPAAAQTTLTWTNNVAGNRDWSTSVANWTADGGATFVAWAQGTNAVFDSVLTDSTIRPRLIGGALKVSHLTANYSVSLDKASGNDADHVELVGDARITVAPGTTFTFRQVRGSVGLTMDGGGGITANSFSYSGGTTILNGTFTPIPPGGNILMLDTSGAANARIYVRGVNNNWSYTRRIIVRGGGTG